MSNALSEAGFGNALASIEATVTDMKLAEALGCARPGGATRKNGTRARPASPRSGSGTPPRAR